MTQTSQTKLLIYQKKLGNLQSVTKLSLLQKHTRLILA